MASFAKESLTGSAETNVITMLQQHGISDSEEAAIARVREMIVEKASQLPDSCQKVLSDPHFVGNNRVERWLAALPYIMSGNSCGCICSTAVQLLPIDFFSRIRVVSERTCKPFFPRRREKHRLTYLISAGAIIYLAGQHPEWLSMYWGKV